MLTRNSQEHAQGTANPPAVTYSSVDSNKGETFHGTWYKCNRAALCITEVVKSMSVERISSISPTVAGSLWLCGWILTLQKSITQEKTEHERLYSTIGFLLAALKRLGRLWPSLNAVYRTPAPEHQTAEVVCVVLMLTLKTQTSLKQSRTTFWSP